LADEQNQKGAKTVVVLLGGMELVSGISVHFYVGMVVSLHFKKVLFFHQMKEQHFCGPRQ
jgi:hypothetical protein